MTHFLSKLFISFVLLTFPSFAYSQSVDEKIGLAYEEAQTLEAIHKDMELLLSIDQKRNEESKSFLIKVDRWEEVQHNHEQLKDVFTQLEGQIKALQDTLGKAILCHYGDKGYGQTIKLAVLAQTAKDFQKLIQGVFFDEELKESYQNNFEGL